MSSFVEPIKYEYSVRKTLLILTRVICWRLNSNEDKFKSNPNQIINYIYIVNIVLANQRNTRDSVEI